MELYQFPKGIILSVIFVSGIKFFDEATSLAQATISEWCTRYMAET